jgi:hypothetical protein
MVKATVKWGKESYDVEVDAASAASDFKLQLFSLTGSFEFPWRTICGRCRLWSSAAGALSCHAERCTSCMAQVHWIHWTLQR